jgi:hypothetical protein
MEADAIVLDPLKFTGPAIDFRVELAQAAAALRWNANLVSVVLDDTGW